MYFKDRVEAGIKLAERLKDYINKDVVVYALPRGGVVTGIEIAKKLNAPLDLVIVRKIGHPNNSEYAIAAIAEDGHTTGNEDEISSIDQNWFKKESEKEQNEAKRRREVYLSGKKRILATGKIAILVDDGIATGLTMEAAIKEIKHQNPAKIILAVPVIPKESAEELEKKVDEIVGLDIADNFLGAIGAYYEQFPQISDAQVISLLKDHD